jgi:hypothetical protein
MHPTKATLFCELVQISDHWYSAMIFLVEEVYFITQDKEPDTTRLKL